MFKDELKLKIIAGKGGDGASSFRREKFIPKGGPDGGDGGNGGDIIFKTSNHLNTLSKLANKKLYKAENGVNGKRKNMHGKNAENLILEVPKGTIIFDAKNKELLADLEKDNSKTIIAKGGKGGMGNARFVSSTRQAPKFAEKGEPGEEKEIFLELKLVADVGIIGLPSAGKSTFISVISNAKPKIADYPFTTLIPNLGIVNMKEFGGNKENNFVIADIPGLIKGASKGKGLGHKFLKHISRTKLLIHIIDGTEEDIIKNYKTINKELKEFDKNLIKLPQIIVLNKIDQLDEKTIKEKFKKLTSTSKNKEIFPISNITKKGIKPLLFKVIKELATLKTSPHKLNIKKTIPILKPHLETVEFEIEKIVKKKNHIIFRIKGKKIEQLIQMTDINNKEGLERIYNYIEKIGIKKNIEKYGANYGDFYKIKEITIPYRK